MLSTFLSKKVYRTKKSFFFQDFHCPYGFWYRVLHSRWILGNKYIYLFSHLLGMRSVKWYTNIERYGWQITKSKFPSTTSAMWALLIEDIFLSKSSAKCVKLTQTYRSAAFTQQQKKNLSPAITRSNNLRHTQSQAALDRAAQCRTGPQPWVVDSL